jgi:hypothetical protein
MPGLSAIIGVVLTGIILMEFLFDGGLMRDPALEEWALREFRRRNNIPDKPPWWFYLVYVIALVALVAVAFLRFS